MQLADTKKPAAVSESPVTVGVTRSQRKSKSEALRRLTLSAAKQRLVDSDDSLEESMDDMPGNPSESDEDDGPEMLASKPNTSSDTEQPMDRMSPSPTSASEKSVLPAAVETSIGEVCNTPTEMVLGPSLDLL